MAGASTVVLDSLTCQVPDDFGGDEPIITVNENEVWPPNDGNVRMIGVRRPFSRRPRSSKSLMKK
jgi:hypothetical protein